MQDTTGDLGESENPHANRNWWDGTTPGTSGKSEGKWAPLVNKPMRPMRPMPLSQHVLVPNKNPRPHKPTPEYTTDFDAFYEEWEPRIRALGVRESFSGQDLEDAVQQFFVDMWTGEYLQKFDPERGVPFVSYIYGHARVRYAGYRRMFWRRGQREVTSDTIETEGKPAASTEQAFIGSPVSPPEDYLEILELNNALEVVYQALKELPATKTKDLARLFRDMVEQLALDGEVNMAEIAKKYGYSRNAILQQIRDLRATKQLRRLRESVRHAG